MKKKKEDKCLTIKQFEQHKKNIGLCIAIGSVLLVGLPSSFLLLFISFKMSLIGSFNIIECITVLLAGVIILLASPLYAGRLVKLVKEIK